MASENNNNNKRVLIIISHPNTENSFNHRLALESQKTLTQGGCEVRVTDLYKLGFHGAGGPVDFTQLSNKENFDYPIEQKNAAENDKFSQQVQKQIDHVKWADVLFFQFPVWWFNVPGILKGWLDRILAYKVFYGGDKSLAGKKWISSVTTEGTDEHYSEGGLFQTTVEQVLQPFNKLTPKFIGAEVLPMHVSYGVNTATDEQKNDLVESLNQHLRNHILDN
mmetsp:Transcript_38525/g.43743  ORF Transcript_38525/g.43743 Transcript_38525/m.43743 type:complete len:222 (+) Transcript_38525:144-809(+)